MGLLLWRMLPGVWRPVHEAEQLTERIAQGDLSADSDWHIRDGFGRTLELGYWVLPKPLDFHAILLRAFEADHLVSGLIDFPGLAAGGAWSPGLSVLASAAAGAVLLGVAAYDFLTAEY